MATSQTYPSLTIDNDGTARIRNSRYKVLHLAAEHYAYGWTAEELLRQHPDLLPEQVYASLAYFYEHRESMIADMEKDSATAHPLNANPLSRNELLNRFRSMSNPN